MDWILMDRIVDGEGKYCNVLYGMGDVSMSKVKER